MNLSRWLATLIGIAMTSNVNAAQPMPPKNEHAVVVHFSYGSEDLTKLFALEDKLEKAITAASVGEYDGNEVNVDGSDGYPQ
jgi:hypothetical protein